MTYLREFEDRQYGFKSNKCPRCGSPDPRKHPAIQFEGEVAICPHPYHEITRVGPTAPRTQWKQILSGQEP